MIDDFEKKYDLVGMNIEDVKKLLPQDSLMYLEEDANDGDYLCFFIGNEYLWHKTYEIYYNSKGEGLGNKFLGNIRECDAIIHVIRCFDDDNIVREGGAKIDPLEDKSVIGQVEQLKEALQGKVYNLNGQLVGNSVEGLSKGVYIVNGKKVIIK